MKTTKRVLSIALILLLALGLAMPAAAMSFPRGEAPAWLDVTGLRRQHNLIGAILVGRHETSLAVLHNGVLVHEEYAEGFDAYAVIPMNSTTKSFVAAMVGVAIEDGYIDCVSQRVVDFFPEARIPRSQRNKRDMTIEHLLTMRSGLPWIGQRDSLDFMNAQDSGLAAFLTPQRNAPGERFAYDGGAAMQTLIAVVERASGRYFHEYANERIFEPLGMAGARWQIFTQDNRAVGAMGLYMNTHDMLRFGQLYIQDGVWDGRRILPEGWVAQTLANEEFGIFFGLLPYSLLWWGHRALEGMGPAVRAQGFAGQLISVYPEIGLVVVRTGTGLIGDGTAAWPLIRRDGRFLYLFC